MKAIVLVLVVAACSSTPGNGGEDGAGADAQQQGSGSGSGSVLHSTLTSSCATLQGRAIVNVNDNLGIAFTDGDSPYTFRGSIQFELPDGFTGQVPNPEAWDGSSPRHIVAVTSPAYELHGNHCWMMATPPAGSVTVTELNLRQGVVKATFNNLPLHSCTTSATCTVSGTIETTGQGVFDAL